MKVVHVLKKIEQIDEDIRELRKLEKTLSRNKSFSTPIYMSIEKQINIMLGDKIKLMELRIDNPPKEFTGEDEIAAVETVGDTETAKKKPQKSQKSKQSKEKPKKTKAEKPAADLDDMPIMTQDIIDQRIKSIEGSMKASAKASDTSADQDDGDEHIKLLDIALEKGSINKSDIESEKKKVRFFKDNFPGGEY